MQEDRPLIKVKNIRWIHDEVDDPAYLNGKKYLPSCTCSNCGYHSNREKRVCPQCGLKTDEELH